MLPPPQLPLQSTTIITPTVATATAADASHGLGYYLPKLAVAIEEVLCVNFIGHSDAYQLLRLLTQLYRNTCLPVFEPLPV